MITKIITTPAITGPNQIQIDLFLEDDDEEVAFNVTV